MKYDPVDIAVRIGRGHEGVARQAEAEIFGIDPRFALVRRAAQRWVSSLYGTPIGSYTTKFCQRCAGSHGPNDPCPATRPNYGQCGNVLRNGPGTTCTFCSASAGLIGGNTPAKPFFQFNNVASALPQGPEETYNDHLLSAATWTCEACSAINVENDSPIRCRICRRYR